MRLHGNQQTMDVTPPKPDKIYADDASKVFDVSLDPEQIEKLRNAEKFQPTPRSPEIDPQIFEKLGLITYKAQDPANPKVFTVRYESGTEYTGNLSQDPTDPTKQIPTGQGKFIFDNGDSYTGSLGRRCKGTFTHSNGISYTGQFFRFQKWGIGRETYPDGTEYRGMFRKGKKDGKGVVTFSNGDVYEGQFISDIRRHIGVYRHFSGEEVNGDWNGDQLNGMGHYTLQSGKMIKSLFNNSRIKF